MSSVCPVTMSRRRRAHFACRCGACNSPRTCPKEGPSVPQATSDPTSENRKIHYINRMPVQHVMGLSDTVGLHSTRCHGGFHRFVRGHASPGDLADTRIICQMLHHRAPRQRAVPTTGRLRRTYHDGDVGQPVVRIAGRSDISDVKIVQIGRFNRPQKIWTGGEASHERLTTRTRVGAMALFAVPHQVRIRSASGPHHSAMRHGDPSNAPA